MSITTENAKRAWNEYFMGQVQFPDPLLASDHLSENGWMITYTCDQTKIEIIAEHKLTDLRHCSISYDGKLMNLESPLSGQDGFRKFLVSKNFSTDDRATIWSETQYAEFIKEHRRLRSVRGGQQLGLDPVSSGLTKAIFGKMLKDYLEHLRVYELAKCPFCQTPVCEALDLYNCIGPMWWCDEPLGLGCFGRNFTNPDGPRNHFYFQRDPLPSWKPACACLKAVQYGIRINEDVSELDSENYIFLGSDYPGVLARFFDQADSAMVCRLFDLGPNNPQGKSYFSLWVVSYFNPNQDSWENCFDEQNKPGSKKFYWPYDLLTYDVIQYFRTGQAWTYNGLDLSPFPSKELVTWELSLSGRWCLWAKKPKLLPTGIPQTRLLNFNDLAFSSIKNKEREELLVLKNRIIKTTQS